jgi:hypothetical protein
VAHVHTKETLLRGESVRSFGNKSLSLGLTAVNTEHRLNEWRSHVLPIVGTFHTFSLGSPLVDLPVCATIPTERTAKSDDSIGDCVVSMARVTALIAHDGFVYVLVVVRI